MPALGVRQMARLLECQPSLVVRYRDAGMPMESDAAARAWLMANVRPDPRTAFSRGSSEGAADGYLESRARREAAEAATAELKLAELQGLLVRADTIRAAHAKRLAGLRESLLQIPARLAAVLAAETDQAKCHDALQRELHAVLASVAQH